MQDNQHFEGINAISVVLDDDNARMKSKKRRRKGSRTEHVMNRIPNWWPGLPMRPNFEELGRTCS